MHILIGDSSTHLLNMSDPETLIQNQFSNKRVKNVIALVKDLSDYGSMEKAAVA